MLPAWRLFRQQVFLPGAAGDPGEQARVLAAVGEPAVLDAAGLAVAGEEAQGTPVELVAAHLQHHVEHGGGAGEAGVGPGPDGFAFGTDTGDDAAAGAAASGIAHIGIAVRDAARGDPAGA